MYIGIYALVLDDNNRQVVFKKSVVLRINPD
jgi:hypothetical protein